MATNTLISGCKTSIIPDETIIIGEWAFAECSGLTNISIPDKVTSIEDDAFYDCRYLTDIRIPESVHFIGNDVFEYCYCFKTIYGYTNSYAEWYANKHGYNFIAIETPEFISFPIASTITYGQTLAESILTGGAASVDGVFIWTDGSISPAVSDSGTTLYSVTFTPADDSYENVTSEISVIVEKAIPVILLEDYNAVYNGNIIKINDAKIILVNNEVYNGSAIYTYYTDQACTKLTQKINGATIPGGAPKNFGIYYVKAYISESDNYTAATSEAARLTISLLKPVKYYSIIATAGKGGTITASDMSIRQNSSKIFIIIPDKGYEISDVIVDGISAGKAWYYIFPNVTSNHTIHATFKPVT
ncbi:MAG: leucine-rich repeat domain-containing protein [Eubacteriales bacterium]